MQNNLNSINQAKQQLSTKWLEQLVPPGLLFGWLDGLEFVTRQLSWSDMFLQQFLVWLKNFSVLSLPAYTLCTI